MTRRLRYCVLISIQPKTSFVISYIVTEVTTRQSRQQQLLFWTAATSTFTNRLSLHPQINTDSSWRSVKVTVLIIWKQNSQTTTTTAATMMTTKRCRPRGAGTTMMHRNHHHRLRRERDREKVKKPITKSDGAYSTACMIGKEEIHMFHGMNYTVHGTETCCLLLLLLLVFVWCVLTEPCSLSYVLFWSH